MHTVKVHGTLCRIFPDDSPCRGRLNTLANAVIKLTPNVGAFMKLNYAAFVKGNRNNRMAGNVHSSMPLPLPVKENDYPVNRAGVN